MFTQRLMVTGHRARPLLVSTTTEGVAVRQGTILPATTDN
jgi:hypothetical protein